MSAFRRRRPEADTELVPPPVSTAGRAVVNDRPPVPSRPANVEVKVPPHIERALITLTAKMQRYVERLDALDRRVDELAELAMNSPSHSDVLEVRLHSAKLAAELARATVELRGEIGLANDQARRSNRASRVEPTEVPVSLPVDVDIEKQRAEANEAADDEIESKPRGGQKGNSGSGWSQSA